MDILALPDLTNSDKKSKASTPSFELKRSLSLASSIKCPPACSTQKLESIPTDEFNPRPYISFFPSPLVSIVNFLEASFNSFQLFGLLHYIFLVNPHCRKEDMYLY